MFSFRDMVKPAVGRGVGLTPFAGITTAPTAGTITSSVESSASSEKISTIGSQPCQLCRQSGTQRCSRCKAPYCSRACQLQDWDVHKLTCGVVSSKSHNTSSSPSVVDSACNGAESNGGGPRKSSPGLNGRVPSITGLAASLNAVSLDNPLPPVGTPKGGGLADAVASSMAYQSQAAMQSIVLQSDQAGGAPQQLRNSTVTVGPPPGLTTSNVISRPRQYGGLPWGKGQLGMSPTSPVNSMAGQLMSGSPPQEDPDSLPMLQGVGSEDTVHDFPENSPTAVHSPDGVGDDLLAVGQTFAVTVVGACGCCLLWAVRADAESNEKRQEVKSQLSSYANDATRTQSLVDISVGQVCAACARDGMWRRGRISSPPFAVGEGQQSVSVQFVDDGVSEVLPTDGLLQLPEVLSVSNVPAQAIKLWLHGLYPSTEGQHNSEMAMSVLNSMTQGQLCEAEVCHASREGVIYVRLSKDGKSVNDALLQTPFVEPYQGRGGSSSTTKRPAVTPSSSLGRGRNPSLPLGRGQQSLQSGVQSMPRCQSVQTVLNSGSHKSNGPRPSMMSSVPGFSQVRMQGPSRSSGHAAKGLATDPSGFAVMQLVGGFSEVRVCAMTEYSHFFVQLVRPDLQQGLQRLNSDMDGLHARTKNASYTPREGDICCARYHADRRFYRSRVERVHADGRVDVSFVDYGNQDSVPVSDLRHMKREFGTLPFQAVRCVLAGVVPANPNGSWSPVACRMLQQPQRLVARLVMSPSTAKSPTLVELYDRSPGFNVLLNEELVRSGHALPSDVAVRAGFPLSNIPPALTPPSAPVTPSSPLPSAVSSSSSTATTPTQPPSFSVTLPAGNSTARTLRDDRAVQLVDGKVYSVEVVYIHHVGMFYLRLVEESLQQQLAELNEMINDVCSSPSSYEAGFHPPVGELCCARLSDNGRYYRAKVHHLCLGDTKVVVYYVDLGQREVVSYTEVRRMTNEMLKLPFQAIPASFYNLTKGPGQWPEEGKRLLHQLTRGKELRCVCHGGQMTYRVELFDETDAEQILDIRAALQMAGIGRIITTAADAKAAMAAAEKGDGTRALQLAAMGSVKMKRSMKDGEGGRIRGTRPEAPHVRISASSLTYAHLPFEHSFNVLVTNVINPSLLHVTLVNRESVEKFLSLCDQIRVHCLSNRPPTGYRPSSGDVCCALFEGDSNYYRVVVEQELSDQRLHVTYIDFGNSGIVSSLLVYPPLPSTADLPVQAIRCSLAIDWPSGTDSWPLQATKLLQEKVNKQFRAVHVLLPPGSDGTPTIDLIDPDTGISVCDELREQCRISSSVSPYHQYMVEAMSRAVLPTDGKSVTVVMTEISSPTNFFVTCVDNVALLNQLLQSMASAYSSNQEPYLPEVGKLCAARFSGDGAWYRAVVNSVSDVTVHVTYVDFGNSETTTTAALQPLRPEHSLLPLQGVKCKLAGLRPLQGQDWDAEATMYFRKLIEGVRLNCWAVQEHSNHSFSVRLARCSSPNTFIVDQMVEGGVAKVVTDIPSSPATSSSSVFQH